jgi:hypothetical protein
MAASFIQPRRTDGIPTMLKPRFVTLVAIVFAAAATRLLPHPLNFAPITAMALFGGAHFSDKRLAFVVPLVAMFLSDLILGLHMYLPVVYLSFALIVGIGYLLKGRKRIIPVAGAAFTSSLLFFILTNFGFWLLGPDYPKTIPGLTACYVAAIPFFQNTLFGDLFYTGVLFGGFAIAVRVFPVLRGDRSALAAM